ncbi:MAG: hypothetical protein U1A62_18645, partial [Pseudomonas sp.]|nr:hypothetical protein [Pseudomonas sp.]
MKIRNRILSVRKNCREQFLTLRSNGPKGGCQGWQAIKNLPGAIFNVAQRRPAGWPPGMAGHQKLPRAILNSTSRLQIFIQHLFDFPLDAAAHRRQQQ